MSFVFDAERAIQAAAYVLKQFAGNKLTRGKLIKLLYLADRRSLVERGFPITGDRVVAMDEGPVLSQTYDLIKNDHSRQKDQDLWSRFMTSEWINVILRADPEDTKLSDNDVVVLQSIVEEFGTMSFSELSHYTHDLADYKRFYSKGTSTTIPPSVTLEVEGKKSDAATLSRRSQFDRHLANLFGC